MCIVFVDLITYIVKFVIKVTLSESLVPLALVLWLLTSEK